MRILRRGNCYHREEVKPNRAGGGGMSLYRAMQRIDKRRKAHVEAILQAFQEDNHVIFRDQDVARELIAFTLEKDKFNPYAGELLPNKTNSVKPKRRGGR